MSIRSSKVLSISDFSEVRQICWSFHFIIIILPTIILPAILDFFDAWWQWIPAGLYYCRGRVNHTWGSSSESLLWQRLATDCSPIGRKCKPADLVGIHYLQPPPHTMHSLQILETSQQVQWPSWYQKPIMGFCWYWVSTSFTVTTTICPATTS